MPTSLLSWDIYEIHTEDAPIQGVSMRGRLRKFALAEGINLLCENAWDNAKCVRFALLAGSDQAPIAGFLAQIVPGHRIELKLQGIANPVLSKLTVNSEERYSV